MGSHSKPRTTGTGRRTTIGALALGATLTGVGLTAAALDPATAVLAASGSGEGGRTQLSGLAGPVSTELSPAADGIPDLASAPLGNVGAFTNAVNGTASGALQSAGTMVKTVTSGTLDISAKAPGTQNTVKPIKASAPAGSGTRVTSATWTGASSTAPSGGYAAKHAKPRSAPPPSGTAPLASAAASGLSSIATATFPLTQSLVGRMPVAASLMQGTGAADTASGLLGTASGTVGGTADGSSGDPVSGVVGGIPLAGSLLGGTGDGRSTLAVPNVSSLTGSLSGLA